MLKSQPVNEIDVSQKNPLPKQELVKSSTSVSYVGASVCKQCHQSEFQAWQGSHHQLSMQEANEQIVLGDFNNAKFNYNGIKSTFFKRDGKFMVRTDGADGQLTDYPISYTFGVTPLQQYLIEFPNGRYQALSIAWDSRPKSEGGQHWFHLYPNEKVDHNDQLHWTKRYQNWNIECAECHSTNLKKGYDVVTDSYKTTLGKFKQTTKLFHRIFCNATFGVALNHFLISQKNASFWWLKLGSG
jgi:hypothetical protein